jgi:hypothetical protein
MGSARRARQPSHSELHTVNERGPGSVKAAQAGTQENAGSSALRDSEAPAPVGCLAAAATIRRSD